MRNDGMLMVGFLPDGHAMFASEGLIAEKGLDEVVYQLVERAWLQKGIDPPGYHRVRTTPFRSDYVLIKAPTLEQAVEKYLSRRRKEHER